MNTDRKAKMTFGVCGFIIGAAVVMIIGFNWGGWTTSSTTKAKSDAAVLVSKAAICVAQFIKDPNEKEKLKEFEKLDSYGMNNTSDYVRKFGWDKMPGEEKADPDVAQACAKGIEVLIKK
jgi:hypothetical protein